MIQTLELELKDVKAESNVLKLNATRFNEKQEELQATIQSHLNELNQVKLQNLELMRKIEDEERLVDQADENLQSLQRSFRKGSLDIAKLQQMNHELEKQLKSKTSKMHTINEQKKQLKQQLAYKETKIAEQKQQIDQLKQEKEEMRDELDREILLNEQLHEQIQFGEFDQ